MKKLHVTLKNMKKTSLPLIFIMLILLGCSLSQIANDAVVADTLVADDVVTDQNGHTGHGMVASETPKPEITMDSPIRLNPADGKKIGAVYEAYLSPEQEGGEEEDTPALIPDQFQSTAPSMPRELRTSQGHGSLSFTNDLSKAYVHVAIENVNPEDITMFHIHCGRPGQLGPIIVDFGLRGDPAAYFEDGIFAMEVLNEDIVAVTDHSEGLVGAFTAGCPILAAVPLDRVKTIAGMQYIAEQGELYFNLHTKGQTYFGDIRGQMRRVEMPTNHQTDEQ
ncbi:MAG: CHRD domain-containing protein [Chloroflexota bacterium]